MRIGTLTTDSVRFRIAALTSLLLLGTLVVTGAALVLVQARLLVDGVDETIERRADDLIPVVFAGDPSGFDDREADTAVQIVVGDRIVAASPPLLDSRPVAPSPPVGRSQITTTVEDPAGLDGSYRLLTRRVETDGGPAIIHVLGDLDDVNEARTILLLALGVALPLVALLTAAITWWMVGRTLGPVEAIRAEVADITGSELDRRVPVPPTGDEIGRLAVTMNEMLDRVEKAAVEQRRFVDDASHELRSPLTRLRAELEVHIAHPDGSDPALLQGLLDETIELQTLAEDLLYLARSDAVPADGPFDTSRLVDLDDIVLDEASRITSTVDVDVSAVGEAPVPGRPAHLRRAVRNLLDNAARHAASTVTVSLHASNRSAVLTITDDGPGIAPDDRERIFERFTRLDTTRGTGGSGLGLAIVRDVVTRHRGTIRVHDPVDGSGTTIEVVLPAGR